MTESDILQQVRLKASQLGAIVWRNNQGAYKDPKGYYIKYGVCNPGGSDLIGYMPLIITEEMIGVKMAIFTALEIKSISGRATQEQINFIDNVNKNGGISAIIRSVDDLDRVIENALRKKL